jgi:hypothetical protein
MKEDLQLRDASFRKYSRGLILWNVENFQQVQECSVSKKDVSLRVTLEDWERASLKEFCQIF